MKVCVMNQIIIYGRMVLYVNSDQTNEGTVKQSGKLKRMVISDADILSSFLRRNAFQYYIHLFDALEMQIVIPQMVMDELNSRRWRERLAMPIEQEARKGTLVIEDFDPFSDESEKYQELKQTIGKGEAAAISMVLTRGIDCASLGSNNYSDIKSYVDENNIDLWTTGRVLYTCEKLGIISHARCVTLFDHMKKDGLYIPGDDYEDYLENYIDFAV